MWSRWWPLVRIWRPPNSFASRLGAAAPVSASTFPLDDDDGLVLGLFAMAAAVRGVCGGPSLVVVCAVVHHPVVVVPLFGCYHAVLQLYRE